MPLACPLRRLISHVNVAAGRTHGDATGRPDSPLLWNSIRGVRDFFGFFPLFLMHKQVRMAVRGEHRPAPLREDALGRVPAAQPTRGCLCLKNTLAGKGKLLWGCSMALLGRQGRRRRIRGDSKTRSNSQIPQSEQKQNLGLGGRAKIRGKAGFVNNFYLQQKYRSSACRGHQISGADKENVAQWMFVPAEL